MKFIFVDTETTGLNSQKHDIIQLAGLVIEDDVVIDSFNYRCQPVNWNEISQEALNIHKITIEQMKLYETPKSVFAKFEALLAKHFDPLEKFIIAGQNVKSFDWRFVVSFWDKHKSIDGKCFQYYFDNRSSLDLLDLTRPLKKHGFLDVENVKLGTIVEALNIRVDGDLHDALNDITATFKSFYKVLDTYADIRKRLPKHEIFTDKKVQYILDFFQQ